MSRTQSTFAVLGGEKAPISYITAGDPGKGMTLGLMHSLAANGADITELGVPFSDPMADGPTIQCAAERALVKGVSLNDVLGIVRAFRQIDRTTPVTLMGYFSPVHKMDYARFAEAAAEMGVDGVLIVDTPVENIGGPHGESKSHDIDCIFLIAPTTTEERIRSIAAVAGGFVYYVSFKGMTGAASLDTDEASRKIEFLRKYISLSIGVGFGIDNAESACKIGKMADIVTVGSRIVKEIENNVSREAEAVGALVKGLKDAVKAVRNQTGRYMGQGDHPLCHAPIQNTAGPEVV